MYQMLDIADATKSIKTTININMITSNFRVLFLNDFLLISLK